LNQKLEEKVPEKMQSTLNTAFRKAFDLIFAKGTGVIEKTYRKQKLEEDYQVQQYALEVKQDAKSLRSFSKKTRNTRTKNLLFSGASGIGMGAIGIGLPDIPVFTGLILKNIYETALQYGYGYMEKEERYFILRIIEGAMSYGQRLETVNDELNEFIQTEKIPDGYEEKIQVEETAKALSKELLYMKFLQGIPVVGVIGGVYDVVYMKQISEYAELKYRRRFLQEQKGNKR
jgi:hypothetical protein